MLRGLGVACLLCAAVPAMGDGYTAMWKQYAEAQKQDKPRTAVAVLHDIQRKSEKERSYGNLLLAMIREVRAMWEIAPDSAIAAMQRIEARQKAWEGTDGVLSALCRTVMYEKMGAPRLDSLLASRDSAEYVKRNVTAGYAPLIKQRAGSAYFGNSLLAVIADHTGQMRELHDYYTSVADRPAACIAAAIWMERGGSLAQVDSLIEVFGDLPECGALAVRRHNKMYGKLDVEEVAWIDEALAKWPMWQENDALRNRRRELTLTTMAAMLHTTMVNTDTEVWLHLDRVCNVGGVRVTLRRVNGKARGGYDNVRTLTKDILQENEYAFAEDSISLGRLPLGVWIVTVQDSRKLIAAKEIEFVVTDLKVICLAQPGEKVRAVAVNAITGQPVPGAVLHICPNDKTERTIVTDDKGEAVVDNVKYNLRIYATKGADNAMKPVTMYGVGYHFRRQQDVQKQCNIFTDRAIYRPGQTAHVALTRYNMSDGKELSAAVGDTVTVILRNAQYDEVERKQAVTDGMGGASVDFVLPKDMRSGTWSLTADGMNTSTANIKVEEYKRPTFDVTLEKPVVDYGDGDTLTVSGKASTYSGVPVANARVAYSVRRLSQWWCMGTSMGQRELLRDTVTTAADGTFSIMMPMVLPKDVVAWRPCFYKVEATVDVTDNAGESHNATMSLPIGNRRASLACEMGKELLADSAITVTPVRRNMAGQEIDGKVTMVLDGSTVAVVEANKPYTLAPDIASGGHTLIAICEGDTVKNDFVAFRKSDASPMVNTHMWCYQSAERFPEDGGEVWLQVGTSDNDVTAYYSVFSGERVIKEGTVSLSNSNITHTLTYKPEYGDGLTIAFAWVKDGQLYSEMRGVERPLPSKKLDMRWTTFRDRLVPGQQEQWAVTITKPDGTPADARMVAVLYDKSLEQFVKHSFRFNDMRWLSLPNAYWNMTLGEPRHHWMRQSWKPQGVKWLQFSYFVEQLYGRDELLYSAKEVRKSNSFAGRAMKISGMALSEVKVAAAHDAAGTEENSVEEEMDGIPVRGDFAETAFFLPNVRTDADGVATMTFTLPESVTTWRFMAVAHDNVMRNATLVADAVAQKPLMVQPNMPRFLRQGDNASIAATVANLTERDESVTVAMSVKDAATERKVMSVSRKVTVRAGETAVVTFPLEATKVTEGEYVCRFTASGAGHTDGEQRMLQVLSDEESVTNTMAYVFEAPTDTLLQMADIMPKDVKKARVKVDYVDNPVWLMIETLPQMAEPESNNAIVLSNALYANRVSAMLKWTESKSENVLTALRKLQNADGSFSWWEGMNGSPYMTTAVLKTLARLNALCGRQADTRQMMDKAFAYMQKEMDKDVSRLREWEKKNRLVITSTQYLDWLYALTLEQRDGGASADWVLGHVAKDMNKADMATKAVAAIVMYNNGKKAEARRFAEAIKEHTVYRKDVGRYFDSYRAAYSWCDYRIPTQTLAIEALRMVTPKDSRTVGEMQRWLLSSKRTQQWDNACNTVNAVHAFFGGDVAVLKDVKGDTVLVDREMDRKDATVRVRKETDCESWAAAYVTFRQKAQKVKKTATGIEVSRTVLVNGKEASAVALKPGDKVIVRIVLTADRDYDFVTVTDNRAACMEPVNARSGYSGGCYKEQKDNSTLYHFNQLAKGTHTVETEYYVDRAGEYNSGTVKAECAYANEFSGVEGAYKLNVRQ